MQIPMRSSTTPRVSRHAVRLLAVILLTACRDASVVSGPPSAATPACTSADCAAFRSMSDASGAALVRTSTTLAGNLKGTSSGPGLKERLARLDGALAAGNRDMARLHLLGALSLIDQAIADPARRAELPDLTAIRLNLEPLILKLGLR